MNLSSPVELKYDKWIKSKQQFFSADLVVKGVAVVVVRDELLRVVVANGDDGLKEIDQLSSVRFGSEEEVETIWKIICCHYHNNVFNVVKLFYK